MKYVRSLIMVFTFIMVFTLLSVPALAQQDDAPAVNEADYLETVEFTPSIIGGLDAMRKNLVYPPEAVRDTVQGMVVVRLLVSETGTIDGAAIVKSDNVLLNDAALAAARKVEFTPAKMGDKPVKAKVMMPVMFKLR